MQESRKHPLCRQACLRWAFPFQPSCSIILHTLTGVLLVQGWKIVTKSLQLSRVTPAASRLYGGHPDSFTLARAPRRRGFADEGLWPSPRSTFHEHGGESPFLRGSRSHPAEHGSASNGCAGTTGCKLGHPHRDNLILVAEKGIDLRSRSQSRRGAAAMNVLTASRRRYLNLLRFLTNLQR